MPVSTTGNKKQRTLNEPNNHVMFEREGYDSKQQRYDFSAVQPVSMDDKYVERDEMDIIDPRTLDMPAGPTGMGEVGGTGVQEITVEGERWKVHRFTAGFSTLREDDTDTAVQDQATREMFQFFGDASFHTGLGPSGQYAQGVWDYLRSNIPSDRTIDCSTYTSEYEGREEQVINYDAVSALNGRVLDPEEGWDMMVGPHHTLSLFNKRPETTNGVLRDSYKQNISDYVGRFMRLPYDSSPVSIPRDLTDAEENKLDYDDLTVTISERDQSKSIGGGTDTSAPVGGDELFLFPNMNIVRNNYWRLYEMGAPQEYQMDERGGKTFHDRVWKYTHKFDPTGKYPDVPDVIHLTNVSSLFD